MSSPKSCAMAVILSVWVCCLEKQNRSFLRLAKNSTTGICFSFYTRKARWKLPSTKEKEFYVSFGKPFCVCQPSQAKSFSQVPFGTSSKHLAWESGQTHVLRAFAHAAAMRWTQEDTFQHPSAACAYFIPEACQKRGAAPIPRPLQADTAGGALLAGNRQGLIVFLFSCKLGLKRDRIVFLLD